MLWPPPSDHAIEKSCARNWRNQVLLREVKCVKPACPGKEFAFAARAWNPGVGLLRREKEEESEREGKARAAGVPGDSGAVKN